MPESSVEQVTLLLAALRDGEREASNELLPIVYQELRGLAGRELSRLGPGQTLQATSLVHEVFMKLVGGDATWQDRRHFFSSCAVAMRNILVDAARTRNRQKRGGNWQKVTLGDVSLEPDERALDLLALDDALGKLEQVDGRQHEIVMLRYFSGLTIEQTAAALGIGTATVDRHWRFARVWLHNEMTKDQG